MGFDLRTLSLASVILDMAVLAIAFGFQYLGGLDPCILCIYQRWPWLAVIVLGSLAFGLGGNRFFLALVALAALIGAGIAGFHVGVEQHWWAGTAECGGQTSAEMTVEALREQLLNTQVTRCDEVAWSKFGISMAGYNMIVALALGLVVAFSVTLSRRRVRR